MGKWSSFAQYLIDLYGENALDLYWDYELNKNDSPWKIPKSSQNKKVWIKCQEKDYHGSYYTTCCTFFNHKRCPYCAGKKVHPKDSLGQLLEDNCLLHIWSDKNGKPPSEYAPQSHKYAYWNCSNNKHENYYRSIYVSNICKFRCPECVKEREESILQEKVRLYLESLNNKNYTILHEHKCTIVAKNPKKLGTNNTLPYDNEIKELKLIIEVHGKQHYKYNSVWNCKKANENNLDNKTIYDKQRLYDRYKRLYAKFKGYYYLEIPYFTDNEQNEWKKLINDKICEITKN